MKANPEIASVIGKYVRAFSVPVVTNVSSLVSSLGWAGQGSFPSTLEASPAAAALGGGGGGLPLTPGKGQWPTAQT